MNEGQNNNLVSDPGRPSTPTLAVRFIGAEIRDKIRFLSIRMGFKELYDAVPSQWQVPDSRLVQQAISAAQELCPSFMIRHCFRSYCFGAILANRNNLKLDRETFFVAAMLHDLGLSDQHADEPGSFEWVGAKLAHDFCLRAEVEEGRAAAVHNSIALHTSLGVAHRYEPIISMLHFGTAMDLFGMRIDEIPDAALMSVLEEYPRSEFQSEFSPCLAHQAQSKPESQIAGAVGVGIIHRIMKDLQAK